jgi:hypothetical protein
MVTTVTISSSIVPPCVWFFDQYFYHRLLERISKNHDCDTQAAQGCDRCSTGERGNDERQVANASCLEDSTLLSL